MNQNTVISKPLLTTWGYKQDAGDWELQLSTEFVCSSIKEQKKAYIKVITITLDAFSSLVRIYKFLLTSVPDKKSKVDGITLEWHLKEDYREYIERVLKAIENYPEEIYEIEIKFDLYAFVYLEKHPDKPIRSWIQYFEESIQIGEFSIDIPIKDDKPSIHFFIEYTLFYPFSYQNNEDNTELFELNQPLLEKAFKNWEQKFNSEIEADGLPGIYKYGFLQEDQW